MQGQDSRFFEEYKRLDKLCGERLRSRNGVSAYIAEMERKAARGRTAVPSWASDDKALKHLRWVRNRLAHESAESRVSTAEDLAVLQEFHRRLLSGQDPLALLEKAGKRLSAPARKRQAVPPQGPASPRSDAPDRKDRREKPRLLPLLLALAALALLAAVLFTRQGKVLIASLLELLSSAGRS